MLIRSKSGPAPSGYTLFKNDDFSAGPPESCWGLSHGLSLATLLGFLRATEGLPPLLGYGGVGGSQTSGSFSGISSGISWC